MFAIKYLRSLGFRVTNDPFAEHSWYFRNALVRANYSDISKNVREDASFLMLFFRNVLMGEQNELKNRYMHLDYASFIGNDVGDDVGIGEPDVGDDVGIGEPDVGDDGALPELILKAFETDPSASMAKVAAKLGVSTRHVERVVAALKEAGRLKRTGTKRSGRWHVLR